jgi:hypothetical protein
MLKNPKVDHTQLAKIVVMGIFLTLLCATLQAGFSPYGFGRQPSFYEHYGRKVQNDKEAFLFCLFGYAYQPNSSLVERQGKK